MGAKIRGVFQWGMRYAQPAALAMIAFAIGFFRGIRRARYVALLVIALAIVMYAFPYLLDAAQCIIEVEQPRLKCLDTIYNRARRDTNLAAIIIALAVTLAAWRPERYRTRRRRARPGDQVRTRTSASARRRSLRNADAPR